MGAELRLASSPIGTASLWRVPALFRWLLGNAALLRILRTVSRALIRAITSATPAAIKRPAAATHAGILELPAVVDASSAVLQTAFLPTIWGPSGHI